MKLFFLTVQATKPDEQDSPETRETKFKPVIKWKKGVTKQERMKDDSSRVFTSHEHTCTGNTHTLTRPRRYGFAMATALTTTGMSGDFPSVYNNHHGNSFSLCLCVCKEGRAAWTLGNPMLCVKARDCVCVCVCEVICA